MHGAHPKDRSLFCEQALQRIVEAAADYRYLLGRGYARASSLKLVGDRFQLAARQRQVLFRGVCEPVVAGELRMRRLPAEQVRGVPLAIDGHNVLITLETALAGGLLIRSDDGFLRDIAETHGAYRESESTASALELLRARLEDLGPSRTALFLDRPLPYSGELAVRIRETLGPSIVVEVVDSADRALKDAARDDDRLVVATSDSVVLRVARRALDLADSVVAASVPGAWIVCLSGAGVPPACGLSG